MFWFRWVGSTRSFFSKIVVVMWTGDEIYIDSELGEGEETIWVIGIFISLLLVFIRGVVAISFWFEKM